MNEKYMLPKKGFPWNKLLILGLCVPVFLAILYEASFRFVFRNFDFTTKIPAEIVVTYFNLPLFLGEILLTIILLLGILVMICAYVKFGVDALDDNSIVGKKVKK
jgi:hypothetical protein